MPSEEIVLWDRHSLNSYATAKGKELRQSNSIEENASFLVRCAEELFPEFATWMVSILPDCKPNYKISTLRIVYKIEEVYK